MIEDARWIVGLRDDWDGEGSPGYNEHTLTRAVELSNRIASGIKPTISPAEQGSIDLHWSTTRGQLLINVPASDSQMPTFAFQVGDDAQCGSIEMPQQLILLSEVINRI